MAIIVVLTGSYFGYQQLTDKGCTGQIPLTVAAAPEIAPAIEATAQQWMTTGANVNGTCVAVSVTGVNPATMAAAVAREHGVTINGLGNAPQSVNVPDVWISDSRTWLLRLKKEASGFTPSDGTPIAQSPIVVAMPTPVAERIGWPNRKLGWKDLLAQMQKADGRINTGLVDPNRDAAGLAGLLALGASAGTDAKGLQAKVAGLRALALGSSALRDDLLQKFPRSNSTADLASSLGAAPLSEEDVVAYNAEQPAVQLAALYLEPSPPGLDYPYAIMPEVSLERQAAATGLRKQLATATFKNLLAKNGLRAPDGTIGDGFNTPVGAPAASKSAAPPADPSQGGAAAAGIDAGVISQALGSWAAITLPGRALAVFDVSGSMKKPVPTAGGLTRAVVTQRAAQQGLSLFDDKWAVGVWVFSTEMDGKRPYREVVPISPLTAARQELLGATQQIVPKDGGDTGLYDTALAAYKEVQDDWQDGRINSVLLFTDGENDNPDGLKLPQLVDALKKANDPKRPVRMVIIGIGTEVNRKELETITNATSAGGVFIAPDPAKISDIFLEAISSRNGANG
ncbi:VWA domain-containing protein [Actinoplanes sp. NPDC049265]|uniref:VWA domain-containing protein n=1 Tax=Actinoplanes sp. NPDC049265 TaxID=3363902 RepID=UPI0037171B1C